MNSPDEIFRIALQHHHAGDHVAAERSYREIIRHYPDHAVAWHNLGLLLFNAGKLEDAEPCYRSALALQPDSPQVHFSLGILCVAQRQFEAATRHYQRANELRPGHAPTHQYLGRAYMQMSRMEDAIAAFEQALRLAPNHADILNDLGLACRNLNRLDDSLHYFERAVQCSAPAYRNAFRCNLGSAYKELGRFGDAIRCVRESLELEPRLAWAHDNLLFHLWYDPDQTLESIEREHRRWEAVCAKPLFENAAMPLNDPSPNRRIRIGYVSADFSKHVVGLTMLPLLRERNRGEFEVFCYADVSRPDEVTARIQSHTDAWRDSIRLSDEQLADQIRRDKIDILIDLASHTAGNRLLVFARKPAPVQATYLAYPGTTGLSAIEYRISDLFLDPLDRDESSWPEKIIRLPDSFFFYQPQEDVPAVSSPPPPAEPRVITFGSLNNCCKTNSHILKLWARVLHAVPNSRLLLHGPPGSSRRFVAQILSAENIAPDRVDWVAYLPYARYMETFKRIDIALDTLPYNGGITTLDALYMGTPVVTLAGETAVGRSGSSILNTLNLRELIAGSPDHFVSIAKGLAADEPRRTAFRVTLRQCIQASPLMNAGRFARNLESAYRGIWRSWCASQSPGGPPCGSPGQ